MDLGASLCRASSPMCLLCPVRSACPSAGSVVRETRAKYTTGQQERFQGSNRYLRGRIVDYLRAAKVEGGAAIGELAEAVGLADGPGRERLETLLAALERDGLVVVDVEGNRVRLPH